MDSFVFYRSFAEAMEDLPPEDFKEVSMALIGYALDGVVPDLPKRLRPYFVLMRPNVEASQKRRAAGKAGGRPKTNGYENEKPMVIENENHRLQDSETNGFTNSKPMVSQIENHRLSNSKTIGYEVEKPNKDMDKDKEIEKDKDREMEKEPEGKPQPRHRYGTYGNVLLSDQEMEKLRSEFPDWEEWIRKVDNYTQSSGKRYKDYLAVIRNWARRDSEQRTRSGPLNNFTDTGSTDLDRVLEEHRQRMIDRVASITGGAT